MYNEDKHKSQLAF